jgi:hypothetical protein
MSSQMHGLSEKEYAMKILHEHYNITVSLITDTVHILLAVLNYFTRISALISTRLCARRWFIPEYTERYVTDNSVSHMQ